MLPVCHKNTYYLFPLRAFSILIMKSSKEIERSCFPTSPESPCTKNHSRSKKTSKSHFLLHDRPSPYDCPRVFERGKSDNKCLRKHDFSFTQSVFLCDFRKLRVFSQNLITDFVKRYKIEQIINVNNFYIFTI